MVGYCMSVWPYFHEPRRVKIQHKSAISNCLLTHQIIGASLSEPHTSVTALRTHVCIRPCLDRPLTVNFK